MTLAERILARAANKEKVSPGEYVTAGIDKVMCNEAAAAVYKNLQAAGVKKIWDPERAIVVLDHYVPPPSQQAASMHKTIRSFVGQYGIKHFYDGNYGVAHQVLMENGHALPGELILGTDSHTCSYGALGAAACGIGSSEMAYVLATGTLWLRVPETIRFILTGDLRYPVMSKDVILKIAGDYSSEIAQYKSVEFAGPAVKQMSIASRMTMSNMAVEIGAKFGFFAADEKTWAYLNRQPGKQYEELQIDEQSAVSRTYHLDLSDLEPQVAAPHSVDNVRPLAELAGTEIHQAVLGSCTNGRLEDLHLAAEILQGNKVHRNTRLLIIPASWHIYRQAMEDGTLGILIDAGAIILNPGCGPCFGAHMGLLAPGERCISSTNRNFLGRMGSSQAEVFLASPLTVAASAVRGRIADPREMRGDRNG